MQAQCALFNEHVAQRLWLKIVVPISWGQVSYQAWALWVWRWIEYSGMTAVSPLSGRFSCSRRPHSYHVWLNSSRGHLRKVLRINLYRVNVNVSHEHSEPLQSSQRSTCLEYHVPSQRCESTVDRSRSGSDLAGPTAPPPVWQSCRGASQKIDAASLQLLSVMLCCQRSFSEVRSNAPEDSWKNEYLFCLVHV